MLCRTHLISNLFYSRSQQTAACASCYVYRDGTRPHSFRLLRSRSFLLAGTVYPNLWPRLIPESSGMLTAADMMRFSARKPLHAAPDRVVTRILRSGVITMVLNSIRSQSPCGQGAQVDSIVPSRIRRVVCLLSLCSFVGIVAGFPSRPGHMAHNRLALRSRGTSRLRTACRRGC